ncbi:hypothetical protein PhCBS80983_g03535 [Powellomyces hirtus]|uniref:Lysosomal dipeptide transporter MFSD1 n=1 Tax=Powellomyces hirtus TaxID=109895 RepID=A0A507E398_9FUNG|nr:hypothetical protein PhCBS80983_g03535 [Powellomyces hirtus]
MTPPSGISSSGNVLDSDAPIPPALRNLVIGRSKSRGSGRRTSLQAVTISPSALHRSWSGKPAPFRRARTEQVVDYSPAGGSLSSNPYGDYNGLTRSATVSSMGNRSERIKRQGAVMRRMSSFGGAPIFIPPPPRPPLSAAASAADLPEEHHLSEEHQVSSSLRWAILILTCLLLFGNYYAYDNPAALNRPLMEYLGHDYDTWQYELNLLYAVYSFPNMFLPFIGGQLVDRMDVKKVLLFFSVVVCLGQTLFAIGVTMRSFGVMLLGRILFGIGGESIGVVQATITTAWFRGKELAFALGLNLCIARFGSVVNANFSPRIEKIWTSSGAVWVGSFTCYLSLCCSILLVTLMAHNSPTGTARSPTTGSDRQNTASALEDRSPLLNQDSNSSLPDHTLLEKGYPVDPADDDADMLSIEEDLGPTNWRDCLGQIAMFPWAFWLVCLICVLLYGTVVPFNNIASDFLMSKWYPGDTETAGTVMSIPDTMSALLVPICGVLVDRYGGRASLLVVCALVIASVHTTLGLTMINPIYPLIFLGLSYSLYGVAIWPSIATIIQHQEDAIHDRHPHNPPPRLLGTAYGLSTSALNTALTIMPLVSAQIRVWGGSFVPVELFFVALALAGAAASAVLWIVDINNGSILQHPEMASDDEQDEHDSDNDGKDDTESEPLLNRGDNNNAASSDYGGVMHASPTTERDNPYNTRPPRVVVLHPGETPPPAVVSHPAAPNPHHRRPSAKYANQPFKPGKAFGGSKVKSRSRLLDAALVAGEQPSSHLDNDRSDNDQQEDALLGSSSAHKTNQHGHAN